MLKLFLRLFVLLGVGYVGCVWVVSHAVNAFFAPEMERYNDELLRGQVYELVRVLRPLAPEDRPRQLALLQPHYGLQLSLVDAATLALTVHEKGKLDAGQFIGREDFTEFITPIDSAPGTPLLRIRFPQETRVMTYANASAYTLLAALIGGVLLTWVWPHWRDLERLRGAANLIGAGQLNARASVGKRSSVRELAEHFNQMAERTQQLISSQRELTNAVSHELRTPIARLEFELNLVTHANDEDTRKRLHAEMRADLLVLEDMVSELLTYARLEHPGLELATQSVDATDWLAGVADTVALEAQARGIACDTHVGGVSFVAIEPQFMARALLNLLRNAIRYARQRVHVSIERTDNGHWCLCVDDDGPGIPAADRVRIFEPFTRLDEDRSRATGGFGLGLAIVRRVAEWHHGTVAATDSPLGGARFMLSWPAVAR
jgi:two-component system, OmpR family, sensor kinase ParS